MLKKLISIVLTTSLSLGAFLPAAEAHHTKRYNSKSYRISRAIEEQRYNGQVGIASWYGHNDGYHGRRTANGERFNKWGTTCAHNSYRFNTILKVTNVKTGRSTTCRVTDKGAFTSLGRVIDLSYNSFSKIATVNQGLVKVRIEKLK